MCLSVSKELLSVFNRGPGAALQYRLQVPLNTFLILSVEQQQGTDFECVLDI